MKHLDQYVIAFSGLKVGNHRFEFEVDDKFFACFEASEITKGKINVTAMLEKQSIMMILQLQAEGTVNVPCDRCSEPFDLPLTFSETIYIKFGEESMDDDEIIVLEHGEHELAIGQKIFELIILHLPSRRIHPEGGCNEEIIKNLEKYSPKDDEKKSDPRWDMLKNIKFN